MGRKKKVDSSIKNNLSYEGKVIISFLNKKTNKIISKKTYKNNGTNFLFSFLAYCFCGNYTSAEPLRPLYIQIFKGGEINSIIGETISFNNPKTVKIIIIDKPTFQVDDNKGSITYEVRIPAKSINNIEECNLFGLFCSENYTSNNKPSAYFLIKNDDGTWGKLKNENTSSDTVIIVNWVLEISNK